MEFQKDILSEIGQLLLSMHQKISVAESVTSGYLKFSFSHICYSEIILSCLKTQLELYQSK